MTDSDTDKTDTESDEEKSFEELAAETLEENKEAYQTMGKV